ncbi:MAG: hypothetical protein K2O54_00750, partial [Prevotella sp.]|nr:hypothetical protein [Prevotella sp.]
MEKVRDILDYIADETFISIWDDDLLKVIWHGKAELAKALHAGWLDYYLMDLESFDASHNQGAPCHGIVIN